MLKDFIKPGMTVIDVGANIGYYTMLAAGLTGDTGKVYSIEPEQGNMDTLMENVMLNGYQNVTLILGAAGNRNGITDLYVSGISSGSHSVAVDRADGGHKVKVPIFTLDNILPQGTPVHLVKSDTEGNDMDVMRGARRVIRENRNIVWTMEVWPSGLSKINESVDSLFALVRANGFTRAVMMDERGGVFVPVDISNPDTVRNYTKWHNSCNVIFTKGRDWNAPAG
jgi:FkbM family methyltransferase